MSQTRPYSGNCLCGAVHITVNAGDIHVGACHCHMCRTWSGGPLLAIECASNVKFEGEDNITVFDSSRWAERAFCRTCGTHLYYRLKKENHYAVPAGLLDQQASMVFNKQIFIEQKPAFYSFANETQNLTGAEAFAP